MKKYKVISTNLGGLGFWIDFEFYLDNNTIKFDQKYYNENFTELIKSRDVLKVMLELHPDWFEEVVKKESLWKFDEYDMQEFAVYLQRKWNLCLTFNCVDEFNDWIMSKISK